MEACSMCVCSRFSNATPASRPAPGQGVRNLEAANFLMSTQEAGSCLRNWLLQHQPRDLSYATSPCRC